MFAVIAIVTVTIIASVVVVTIVINNFNKISLLFLLPLDFSWFYKSFVVLFHLNWFASIFNQGC